MKPATLILSVLLCSFFNLSAQKKILDHDVYDGWQSVGERQISNNGEWIAYAVNVQEGDNELYVRSTASEKQVLIPRGYSAAFTEDSRYLVCRIRPHYSEIREARVKKKRPADFPKDSICILELATGAIEKISLVKSYRLPEKSGSWIALHMEPKKDTGRAVNLAAERQRKLVDSLQRTIDSLKQVIANNEPRKKRKKTADEDDEAWFEFDFAEKDDNGAELILRNLENGREWGFPRVEDYAFSREAQKLVYRSGVKAGDSTSLPTLIVLDLSTMHADTIARGFNKIATYSFSRDGKQLAFVAERDSSEKALLKYYKLWYYHSDMDSAMLLVDQNTTGMHVGYAVSPHRDLSFSKSGQRLFFGSSPIPFIPDTSVADIDKVDVDIWHYNEDYLQTVQLSRLRRERERNYLAVFDLHRHRLMQLSHEELPDLTITNEGDGDIFIGIDDRESRLASQWTGNTLRDIYAIDLRDGEAKLIKRGLYGSVYPSPTGNVVLWYDRISKNYYCWKDGKAVQISRGMRNPLYDELHDLPAEPSNYGVMGWLENDSAVFVYDRYDIWKLDPSGKTAPLNILSATSGRNKKLRVRYISTEREKRYFNTGEEILIRHFNETDKSAGMAFLTLADKALIKQSSLSAHSYGNPVKSRDASVYVYTKESFTESPDLYLTREFKHADKLTTINPQQAEYNWGTAELFHWKAYDGKQATGIVYKPEDFDPEKKYPVLLYFYERVSDGLHNYIAPSPTPSRLNITFFVSRGYIVMTPDIHYRIGHPGKSAYNYVVSGAKALAKNKWVDASRIGIQGQSWGGYQVAQLVTMTDMFRAAWSGAPVANMTSAYGGIRWQTGLNRQFQYEQTQSRIGATLWEKPELYIENSPLFHLPKVKTPMVIMHNDADGAVPWYQGIELFTALRRLGKPAWLLNYNGEAHNLVERKNRKDIQIRQQQFFDWLLKDELPARWITEGVPAVRKGSRGFETVTW